MLRAHIHVRHRAGSHAVHVLFRRDGVADRAHVHPLRQRPEEQDAVDRVVRVHLRDDRQQLLLRHALVQKALADGDPQRLAAL